VGDQQRDGGKEPLTEREREALQELAREIVREAALQERHPAEQDALLEGEKLLHETAKTQAFITAALLGASGAAWFIPDPKHLWLLLLAFVLALFSLAATLQYMYSIATALGFPPSSPSVVRARRAADFISTFGVIVAIALLALYVVLNQ
jgi:hypothetical protein